MIFLHEHHRALLQRRYELLQRQIDNITIKLVEQHAVDGISIELVPTPSAQRAERRRLKKRRDTLCAQLAHLRALLAEGGDPNEQTGRSMKDFVLDLEHGVPTQEFDELAERDLMSRRQYEMLHSKMELYYGSPGLGKSESLYGTAQYADQTSLYHALPTPSTELDMYNQVTYTQSSPLAIADAAQFLQLLQQAPARAKDGTANRVVLVQRTDTHGDTFVAPVQFGEYQTEARYLVTLPTLPKPWSIGSNWFHASGARSAGTEFRSVSEAMQELLKLGVPGEQLANFTERVTEFAQQQRKGCKPKPLTFELPAFYGIPGPRTVEVTATWDAYYERKDGGTRICSVVMSVSMEDELARRTQEVRQQLTEAGFFVIEVA